VMIDLDFLTSPQPVAKCYVFCFALFSCHQFDAAKYYAAQEKCDAKDLAKGMETLGELVTDVDSPGKSGDAALLTIYTGESPPGDSESGGPWAKLAEMLMSQTPEGTEPISFVLIGLTFSNPPPKNVSPAFHSVEYYETLSIFSPVASLIKVHRFMMFSESTEMLTQNSF
ncbi:hypothetical protein DBR06_SOUSAS20810034, partial [Sousa chinensis]